MKWMFFCVWCILPALAAAASSWSLVYAFGPSGRRSCTAWCTGQQDVYVFGGKTKDTGRVNDLWHFNGREWNQLAVSATSAPSARSGACGWTASDGSLYLFGGRDDAGRPFSDVWRYSSSWTRLADAPYPGGLYGASCWQNAQQSAFYVFGGMTANSTLVNTLYSFAPANQTWTLLPSATLPAVDDRYAVSPNGYLLTGSDLYRFDSAAQTLVKVGPATTIPQRHDYIAYVDHQGRVCFVGGRYDSGMPVTGEGAACYTDSAWIMHHNSIAPTDRWGSCACGKAAFGGASRDNLHYYNSLWIRDTSTSASITFSDVAATVAAVFSTLSFLLIAIVAIAGAVVWNRRYKMSVQSV